jgi:hypothetical protein
MLVVCLGMMLVGYAGMTVEVVRWVKSTTGKSFEDDFNGGNWIVLGNPASGGLLGGFGGGALGGSGGRGKRMMRGLRDQVEVEVRRHRDTKLLKGGYEDDFKGIANCLMEVLQQQQQLNQQSGVDGGHSGGVGDNVLIGRQHELSAITGKVKSLISGDSHQFGSGVWVVGEPGKSLKNVKKPTKKYSTSC